MSKHRVRVTGFKSGERFPILLDSLGHPLFNPTLFAVTELRMKNLASNTISNALRAIQFFVTFLEVKGIELPSRFAEGQTLKLHEVEELVGACRKPLKEFQAEGANQVLPGFSQSRATQFERFRSRLPATGGATVSPAVVATRLQCIRDYVRWLSELHLAHVSSTPWQRGELRAAVDAFSQALETRMPSGAPSVEREGVDSDICIRLQAVTRPDSPENPWADDHSRVRNALIIDWLFYLGLRRGELLNVRVSDIDFRKGVVTVVRRPDAADDPRRNQPSVKTRGRDLPMSTGLISATRNYILNFRAAIPAARRHGYLFVASGTGIPLSTPALSKAFAVLRAKVPGLPSNLSPHVLRHTWNDRFSEEMDRQKVPEETERKTRSYLMGWSETSGTAATYTRRHVREKAKRVSLELQERMLGDTSK